MSLIYNYQLVEPLILLNILINLLAISQQSSVMTYQLFTINYKLTINLSTIRYFYQT